MGAKHPCLLVGQLRQAAPAHAAGEAEIVTDKRTRRRLSTDPALVDDQGAESLRGAVDGRRQPRRSGAHDHQVEVVVAWLDWSADSTCDLGVGRIGQNVTVGKYQKRKRRVRNISPSKKRPSVGRVSQTE